MCVVWGTTYLGIRVALETMPPFLMAGARWVAAGALLIAGLSLRGARVPPPSRWALHALLGLLLIGFGNGAVVWAQQTVPSGLAALLVAVTPFWMLAIERLNSREGHGERSSGRRVAGLTAGFAGVSLLVWPEVRAGAGAAFLWGVAATQVATIAWAIGSNLTRRRHADEHVLAATALQMVFGGVILLAASAVMREPVTLDYSARSIAALAYLLVAGSIVAFSAYTYALQHLPLSTVSLYSYVNPVIAVALGIVVLGEPFTWRLVVAGAVVLVSVVVVRR